MSSVTVTEDWAGKDVKIYSYNVYPNTALGKLESVTLDGTAQKVDKTGYETKDEAIKNAINIDFKVLEQNKMTIVTGENIGGTPLYASILVTDDPTGNLTFTAGSAISGKEQTLSAITGDSYIIIRLENGYQTGDGETDYAFYAYHITNSVG